MRHTSRVPVPPVRCARRRVRGALLAACSVLLLATSSAGQVPTRSTLDADVRARTGQGLKVDGDAPLPPAVVLTDGVTSDEVVATALWKSPTFQATLADLGVARADVAEAGLLRNPVLSLLFPLGAKQLEWTLQFPFEVIWQRPRRVAAATANARAVGERLAWDSLALIAHARTAHVDALTAEQRLHLATENADLARRLAAIADARFRAGDISDMEARAARNDAARAEITRRAVEQDRELARVSLGAVMGVDAVADGIRAVPDPAGTAPVCVGDASQIPDALASRPDVRAAELVIEGAAQRARWERSRVMTLIGILDGNGTGANANAGPGVNMELPVFFRNQGAVSRADAEVERASQQYAAVRHQVIIDVRTASARLRQAEQARAAWRDDVMPSLETEQRQAEAAYQAGEVPLLTLLDASRRLVEGRLRLLDAEADVLRSTIALERSIGRSCHSR